ncbi:MAG: conjugal transfer protein TraH [Sphingobium sp.]|nr:conjugal transfer protein TraH [Sphingobium sp.]
MPPPSPSPALSRCRQFDGLVSERRVGGAANVNGPTAFQGQSAGYYSLGNVWTRFPQKTTNIANLQLPRARAGCGGIDIFAGSFSFINASEIVAMLKAVANNAVGFAFSLAIDTVCPECSKIMQEFSQKAQLMNNLNINSCEMAQGLVGGIWPKGDLADKAICEAIGNSEGIFTDYAAAKHGCGTGGSARARRRRARANMTTSIPACRGTTPGRSSRSRRSSRRRHIRPELAEYAMTLLGTIIYVPPKDDEPGKFVPIVGEASSTLVTSLLDGTTNGNVLIFDCDEPTSASIPGFKSLSLPASKALRPRVAALIGGMVQAIRDDTAITDAQKELLQVASIPLYKILTVQAAYGRGHADRRSRDAGRDRQRRSAVRGARPDRQRGGPLDVELHRRRRSQDRDVAGPGECRAPGARRPAGEHASQGQCGHADHREDRVHRERAGRLDVARHGRIARLVARRPVRALTH